MTWCYVVKSTPGKTEQCRLLTRVPGTIRATSRNTILPNQHANTIAVVIPALTFNLDMLSQRIETSRFHGLYVIYQRIIGRRGQQSVRPIALIQHAAHKIRRSIQIHPWYTGLVRLHLNGTKRAIAPNKIGRHAILPKCSFHGIEVRSLRRPQLQVIYLKLRANFPCFTHRKPGEKNVLPKLVFERKFQLQRARLRAC